ncbi:aminotransferase-like domain-containing protein [Roseitranquillus sediminis]|uniref:aminotransferase-like domain-containing protein n=1 Tax=Roseitranquillus sediminis TaxID=2809051 RepID=UPI001D0C96F2|nr:PLP-dependent aminotransferase family protein [Roseitranquillus sediminis]MBM9593191.1 PLP-dependent aminotransferase family protein [Roseitranquillus sediminis]
MVWYPKLPFGEGPRYLQIVDALRSDIATGTVAAGEQLPTHREMASRLGLSVGTVSKAYAAAERRGLISGQVGRGTFVMPPSPELSVSEAPEGPRLVNLALNAPPATGEDQLLARTLAAILEENRLPGLLGYLPHQGREDHRVTVADWISRHALRVEPANVYITHGAQHAISVAARLLARQGASVLTENLTYSGMTALALMEGYALHGVAMDAHGLVPAALDRAFGESGAKVLYCTPTLQSATAILMPAERRREIAEVVQRHDAWVIEDDAYGFLCSDPLPTLASYLPDRSFYIVSFAKCLSPGLRVGAMVAPTAFRDRTVNAIRSTGWMATPLMADLVARTIGDGSLDKQIELKRAAAAERTTIAREMLGSLLAPVGVPAFHAWLQMPAGRTSQGLSAQAAQAGITLAAPSPLRAIPSMGDGIRLCLGGASTPDALRGALATLREILSDAEMALV